MPEQNAPPPVAMEAAQRMLDYIEAHIGEPLAPERVARAAHMSTSAAGALFRAACDMPIMEYVKNRRLSLAGEALLASDVRVIDLALAYGYETPEAFSKAFARFHGYPPSLARRLLPRLAQFAPMRVRLERTGGWMRPTNARADGQDAQTATRYNGPNRNKGGIAMAQSYQVRVADMRHKREWNTLLSLARRLSGAGLSFKVDGKTMVFAHGLEFEPDKICLTFKWGEEARVLAFFAHGGAARHYRGEGMPAYPAFKYFDALYEGMIIRCMFFGECPDCDEDEFLYRDTDLVTVEDQPLRVQSLDFYLQNAEHDGVFYDRVAQWVRARG